jgi:RimJ/RimL family protein N-acetyltransferase
MATDASETPASYVVSSEPAIPRIDTERFYLRALSPGDASQRWLAWRADPEVMHPQNEQAQEITLQHLQAYIAQIDPSKRLLVGVFDCANHRHIGYYRVELDQSHRLATVNVIIGDKDYWGRGVVLETRAALLDYLFEKRNVAKAVGMPPARNFPSIFNYRAQGWRLEGILRAHRESRVSPGARIDQLLFALTKEDWIALRGKPRA